MFLSLRTFHSLWPFSRGGGEDGVSPLWDGMIQLSQNLSSIVSGAVSAFKLTSASRGGRAAGVWLERLLQLNARCTGAPEYFQLHKHLRRAHGRVRQGCQSKALRCFRSPSEKQRTSRFFSTGKRKPSELAAVTLLKTDLVGRCVESLLDRPRLRMPLACRK